MYTIHNIRAYIISITPRGDADAMMICVSDEYGLMYVSIKGIRKEASKHRFVAQPYTFINMACVSGKAGWRLTGIEEIERINIDSPLLKPFMNFGNLINKLVHGEEQGIIFSILFDGWNSVKKEKMEVDDIKIFERVIALRILHSLGYVGDSTITHPCLDDTNVDKKLIEHVRQYIKPITTIINTSIRASGMS